MLITVLADASYCPTERVGGYGYWIASAREKFGGHGAFKGEIADSVTAEMMAVVNALHFALQRVILPGDAVLIQTDCIAAISAFKGERQNLKQQESKAVSTLLHFKNKFEISIVFRHVKGHSQNMEARYVSNNLCDKRARKGLEHARRLKKCQQLLEIIDHG